MPHAPLERVAQEPSRHEYIALLMASKLLTMMGELMLPGHCDPLS
jgi:hypothetical protein